MSNIIVKVVSKNKKNPQYSSKMAAGADIFADIENSIIIKPKDQAIISTGLSIELPEGFEAQIRPRSGLAAKYGISIVNTPGTIDADYRGEIKIILINLGQNPFKVSSGDRIAQMVIAPVIQASFIQVDTLNKTERGVGGFGSTGV